MGDGTIFQDMNEFTDAAVRVIGGMCPCEMAAALATVAEAAPQVFQFAMGTLAGSVFEQHA